MWRGACSLTCRTFEGALAECCHLEGVGLLAYSPLAMGLLSVRSSPLPCHPVLCRCVCITSPLQLNIHAYISSDAYFTLCWTTPSSVSLSLGCPAHLILCQA